MGFGYDVVKKLNPRIMANVSAYGQFGPYRRDARADGDHDDEGRHRSLHAPRRGRGAGEHQDSRPWERRAMVEVPDFLAGTIAVSGDFWHFGRTPAIVGSTPKVGEHNEEVLSLLGYSKEEIAKLYANDVIGNWDHYDAVPG